MFTKRPGNKAFARRRSCRNERTSASFNIGCHRIRSPRVRGLLATARSGQIDSRTTGALTDVRPPAGLDRELPIIYDIGRQLVGMRDMQKVAQLVIERARAILQTDVALIAIRDPVDKNLHLLACVGNRTKEFMGFARPVERGIAVYERRPMHSADFLNDNRLSHHPDTDARIRAEGLRSVLVVPLTGSESIVGMICVC